MRTWSPLTLFHTANLERVLLSPAALFLTTNTEDRSQMQTRSKCPAEMSGRSETWVRCGAPAAPGVKIAGRRWEKLGAYLCRRVVEGMEEKGVQACVSCKTQGAFCCRLYPRLI